MLDFFLVLGQVPGTHFFLTFTEIFSTYTILLTSYILHRDYHVRTNFYARMRLIYIMYSSRVLPGRVKKRVILPDHISLIPLVKTDFENFRQSLEHFQHRVQLNVERILPRDFFLRHP
jgi:hypothetical protein